MDKIVILAKIEHLLNFLKRLEEKRPSHKEELVNNYDLQDIISINLERAVQLSVDIALHIIGDTEEKIPDTMAESFSVLAKLNIIPNELMEKLKKSVGFRNISIHEYKKIDWEIVYEIITKHLTNFKDYIRHVSSFLEKK